MSEKLGERRESDSFARRLLAECGAMERLLIPIARDFLWQGIGKMTHVAASSTVLQQRRGYRAVYRYFVRSHLSARLPLSADLMRDLLEAKDVAQLYEIWCYFSIVHELETLLGRPSRAERPRANDFQIQVPWDFEVAWPNGIRVTFNPRFSRTGKRHSYSVPLRPDIGLEILNGPNSGLHLMDAKFRLERFDEVFAGAESIEAQIIQEERLGTFKRADLYKMHAYRDALSEARSVWVLYPGDTFQFFSANESEKSGCYSPGLPMDGVGAIPMQPGDFERVQLRTVLEQLIGL
jgi:predicted component of viral defense system (DUF524 family)